MGIKIKPGRILLLLFLFSPFLILFFSFTQLQIPKWGELQTVLFVSGKQAVISSILSLGVGFWGALGLLNFKGKGRQGIEIFLIIPSFLPALTILTAILNIWPKQMEFPFGWLGVVLIHVIISSGLIAVSLGRTIEQRLGAMCELAYIEGASALRFWSQIVLPLMRPQILRLFLMIFIFCFTSFSVPLIVGGINGGTLETLIYEKIRLNNAWGEALGVAFFQMLIIFLMAWLLLNSDEDKNKSYVNLSWLALPAGLILPVTFSVLVLLGMSYGSWLGYQQILIEPGFFQNLLFAISKTIIISIGVGLNVLLLCAWTAWVGLSSRLERLILGLVSPSAALTGLALLIVDFPYVFAEELRIILGLSLLFYPALMRISGASALRGLSSQVEVARLMGASNWQVFQQIVWPQAVPTFGFLSGLAAFWACGDFALSSIVARSDLTLALVIKNLLSFYRIELATFLLWPLLICGALIFSLFLGWNHVIFKKSNS